MADQQTLRAIFEDAAGTTPRHLAPELAYRHMMVLAEAMTRWANDRRLSPEAIANLIGMAESLRELALEVGPGWNPPAPPTVTIFGFLGRKLLDEPTPPAAPPR